MLVIYFGSGHREQKCGRGRQEMRKSEYKGMKFFKADVIGNGASISHNVFLNIL